MEKTGFTKRLWRNRKTLWKKYQGAFWIEVAALIIIFVGAAGCYYMVQERQGGETQAAMSKVQSAVSTAIEHGDEEEVVYKALEAMPNTGDDAADDCWEIGLYVYDESGEVISGIEGDTVACRWQSYQEPEAEDAEGEIITEYFSLDLYFSDAEMSDFFSWYDSYQDSGSSLSVSELDGYYKGKGFQLLRVVFVDDSTREVVYELEHETYNSWEPTTLVCRMADLSQESSADVDEMEFGYIEQYIYTTPAYALQSSLSLSSDAGQWLTEEDYEYPQAELLTAEYSDYSKAVSGVHGIGAYECQIVVNLRRLICCLGEARQDILPLALFSECGAAFAIGFFLYFKKKQEKIRQMRNTFLCAIAHEMKTPAAVIKNSVECLEAGLQPEKQEHYYGMIAQEADHMNEMLNRMLIYTQISDSGYELKKEECSLGEMAHQLCHRYEDMIKNRQLSLIWDEKEPGTVCCDMALIEMVTDNFISNAVKFCAYNGIVRVTVSGNGIAVYNEGKELSEEEMVHIWEPLYRSDEARSAEDDSLGMGLAISEAILKMHRAGYGVRNEAGGPEFWFSL